MSFFENMLRNITTGSHGRHSKHGGYGGQGSSHHSGHRPEDSYGDRTAGFPQSGGADRSGSCPACRAPLATGAKFCSQCGNAVPAKRFCEGCSAALADGARFCGSCGKSV